MSRTSTIIAQFKAETLLEDSAILFQINQLKNDLKYRTDGTLIAFDDYYLRLQRMIDELPRLKLENSLPGPGTENQYIIQLVEAMDGLLEKAELVEGRVIHFQSKLKDALGQVKRLQGAFDAWYILAASEVMTQMAVKLPPNAVKALADSEFTRLMDGLDIAVGSLLLAVNVQQKEISNHKKVQQEKFSLGKDQANASWTSSLPNFSNNMSSERTTAFEIPEAEEEETDVPAFVSKRPMPQDEYRLGPGTARIAEVEAENVKAVDTIVETAKIIIGQPTIETFNEASPGVIMPAPATVTLPPAEPVCPYGYDQENKGTKHECVVHKLTDYDPPPAPPVKKTAVPATAFVPPADGTVMVREKEGFPEKIHCGLCHRRIKVGQTMFQEDTVYYHAVEQECTSKAPVERSTERHLPVPGPVSDDKIHHGPFPPGHVDVPEKGTSVPKEGTVTASALSDLLNKARKHTMSPEEAEEQRRGFAAGNLAVDSDRPLEEIRKEVDAAADAMAATPEEIPLTPRKPLVFMDEEQEIL